MALVIAVEDKWRAETKERQGTAFDFLRVICETLVEGCPWYDRPEESDEMESRAQSASSYLCKPQIGKTSTS